MRLGEYECNLYPGKVFDAYQQTQIHERHRHRYEFNDEYRVPLGTFGLNVSGENSDDRLVEVVEYSNHPWFVGVQFHPEFTSNPRDAHPLFVSYMQAILRSVKGS